MNAIAQETRTQIPESSIHKLILEITIIEYSKASKNQNEQVSKFVSFSLLNKLFNKYFNIQDKDDAMHVPYYIDRIQW